MDDRSLHIHSGAHGIPHHNHLKAWCITVRLTLLATEDRFLRYIVVGALGDIGDQRAIAPLIDIFRTDDKSLCMNVVHALRTMGEPAWLPLLHAVNSEDSNVRFWAATTSGYCGDARALPVLESLRLYDTERTRRGCLVQTAAKKAIQRIQKATDA